MEKSLEESQDCENLKLEDSERQRCEVWTRVMGYHRPVSSFNKGKKSEHHERLHFQEARCHSVCN